MKTAMYTWVLLIGTALCVWACGRRDTIEDVIRGYDIYDISENEAARVEAMRMAVEDPDAMVSYIVDDSGNLDARAVALRALAAVHPQEACQVAERMMRSSNVFVRYSAVSSLGLAYDVQFNRILVDALEDADPIVRQAAVLSLPIDACSEFASRLCDRLETESDERIRSLIVEKVASLQLAANAGD